MRHCCWPLGAEIGTCADTLLATIGRSRAAVKAGVFHLLFNVVSVINRAIPERTDATTSPAPVGEEVAVA
jgi:Na+/phosphate symporter